MDFERKNDIKESLGVGMRANAVIIKEILYKGDLCYRKIPDGACEATLNKYLNNTVEVYLEIESICHLKNINEFKSIIIKHLFSSWNDTYSSTFPAKKR